MAKDPEKSPDPKSLARGQWADALKPEIIRELAALLNETHLSEIEIEAHGLRLRVARQMTIAAAAPASAPAAPLPGAAPTGAAAAENTDFAKHPGAITSPMVGTAYIAPEPGAAPFVKVGDSVTAGQTVLIVEAMKTMNQIPAPKAGKVTRIFVTNGQPVEFGEPLMLIE